MKTNEELQKDVQDAIKWEPLLNAAEIGVTVKDGVVTLTGVVDCYSKKSEAENAAKGVIGVQAVVEKIEIQFGATWRKTDTEIATEILNAFKWTWDGSDDKVQVKVENGWVTLSGELQWNYQKESARKSASNLLGVKGVTNNITIKSESHDQIEKEGIEKALSRNWSIDEQSILVKVSGNKVSLTGIVHSLFQKDEAERIAWNAPGVWSVDNELSIVYKY